MSKKDNVPKGVRQEFDDIDYWHKLSRTPSIKLTDGTIISEYEYQKKFMYEFYGNSFSRNNPDSNILKTEEQKREARRNNNNTNRDALNVIKKTGRSVTLLQVDDGDYFNHEVEAWENTFKNNGYEEAFSDLIQFSSEEVGMDFTNDNSKALIRMYFRIKKFLKMIKKDMKAKVKMCKQCNKQKPASEFYAHRATSDGLMHKCVLCIKENRDA